MRQTACGVTCRISLTAFACFLTSCHHAPDPRHTITNAYDWYVQTLKSGRDPFRRAELRQFVTDGFLQSLETVRLELDNSPFLDSENFNAMLAIQDVKTHTTTATARVTLAGRMIGKQSFNVFLKQEEKRWKIDDVKLAAEE